jgi:hypothetical protein
MVGFAMKPEPIRARLISDRTCAANGITISAGDPVRALANRLVRDGYDPEMSMVIWRGKKPWRYVAAIGRPDQMKVKAKSGGSGA